MCVVVFLNHVGGMPQSVSTLRCTLSFLVDYHESYANVMVPRG